MPLTPPAGWYPLNGELRYWDGVRWTEHRASAAPPAPATRPVLVTDAQPNGAMTVIAWVIAVVTFGYMLPWAIAATRGKSNSGGIAVLNLLLGWSLVGWVVAPVMACAAHQTALRRP